MPAAGDALEQDRVHRLARPRAARATSRYARRMPPAVIASDDGHQHHRALGGPHARLAHDADAVRDGLDAGVGAAAERVGAHEELERAEHAERVDRAADACRAPRWRPAPASPT